MTVELGSTVAPTLTLITITQISFIFFVFRALPLSVRLGGGGSV